ncbi:MAG: sigma-70 family RNA polymerase sigma factor [Chloroflexi bacterium]|nr:sigma-70 family RNA polymerase sigma factor [Chloroflexota bacterium]
MNDRLAVSLAGDLDGSFEQLVRDHQDRLYSLALRYLGDASDAEELTQDAFVRAYRALAGYEPQRRRELQVRPWLSTIVLNLCRNRARRVRPAQVDLDGLDAVATHAVQGRNGAAGQPETHALLREDAEVWARRVRALPARYREPLLLRYVDDLAYAEISTALGIPEGTLRAQVHRGLALLRSALEQETAAAGPDGAAGRSALQLAEVAL